MFRLYDSYIIDVVDNVDGMNKQEIKKFELELRDDIVFTLSKLDETLIKNNSDLSSGRPQEIDLVYFPTTNAF